MKHLPIDSIRLDGDTQPRAEVSPSVAGEYAEAMLEGDEFPPVVVFHDGEDYWLADGFHRLAAAKSLESDTIAADVRQGSVRDAVLYGCGANATHGLRRSNADKRRSVLRLLRDAEWSQWSDREIARKCTVGNELVSRLRRSICAIRTDGGDERTLSVVERQMDEPSLERPRKVKRGGTTYTQNTANIGKPKLPKAEQAPSDDAPPEPQNGTGLVEFDQQTGEVVSHPWTPEQQREHTRRGDLGLDLSDSLTFIAGLDPDQVCEDVLPEDREEIGGLLKTALDRLTEIHSAWRKRHVSEENGS